MDPRTSIGFLVKNFLFPIELFMSYKIIVSLNPKIPHSHRTHRKLCVVELSPVQSPYRFIQWASCSKSLTQFSQLTRISPGAVCVSFLLGPLKIKCSVLLCVCPLQRMWCAMKWWWPVQLCPIRRKVFAGIFYSENECSGFVIILSCPVWFEWSCVR